MAFGKKGKQEPNSPPVVELRESDVNELPSAAADAFAPSEEAEMALGGEQDLALRAKIQADLAKSTAGGGAVGRPRKKRSVKKIIFLVVVLAVAGLLLFNFISGLLKGPTPTFVEVAPVAKGTIQQTLSTNGVLTTGEKITVFSPVTAPLASINAEVGRTIAAGETLFTYDVAALEQNYKTAQANNSLTALQKQAALNTSNENAQEVVDAQASVDNLKIQEGIAQERLDTAATQYTQLDGEIKADEATLLGLQTRYGALSKEEKLEKEGLALGREIDALEGGIKQKQQQLAKLNAAMTVHQQDVAYQSGLKSQMETIRNAADGAVLDNNARQQLAVQGVPTAVLLEAALADLNKGQTGVQAPISGVVTALPNEVGALASQFAPLCTIESLSKVNVIISLSRFDLERVREGQKAVVTSLGKDYNGTVTKIDNMATQTLDAAGASTGFVNATVSLQNPDDALRLGIEASVVLSTGEAKDVIAVPISAVNTDVEGTYCFVMEEGYAHRRRLVVGMSSDNEVEIVEGLAEGDQVILSSQNIGEGAFVSTDLVYQPAAPTGLATMIG